MLADLFRRKNVLSEKSPGVIVSASPLGSNASEPRNLSAVFAAVEIRSNAMACLPAFLIDKRTKNRVGKNILRLLNERPNPVMSPSTRKKLLEESVLLTGNAYDWIIRDPVTREPTELIPIPGNLVTVKVDETLTPWYVITHPVTQIRITVANEDICHYKGPSKNGFVGMSILSYAARTIQAGQSAQEYNAAYYESGGHPSGILQTEADLGGYVENADGTASTISKKEAIRQAWDSVHSGSANAFKVAVLDLGLKYTPLSVSHRDAQFVEQQNITVQDIARFFSVPLYKLQSGKQSYNANEQNAIEFLQQAIQPRVVNWEEEQSFKLLFESERKTGLEIRYNMTSVLRADSKSRAEYYREMVNMGAYSVNDVLALEDMPSVAGGDEHLASLNYVPLSIWKQLSITRNGGDNNG